MILTYPTVCDTPVMLWDQMNILPSDILYSISEFCTDPERSTILLGLGSEYIALGVQREYPNYPWHLDLYIEWRRVMDHTFNIHADHEFYMYIKPRLIPEAKKYMLPYHPRFGSVVSMEGFKRLSQMGGIGPYVRINDRMYPVLDPELTKIDGATPALASNNLVMLLWIQDIDRAPDGDHISTYYSVRIAYNRYGVYDPYISSNYNPHMFGYESPEHQLQMRSELNKFTRDNIHRTIYGGDGNISDIQMINHIRILNRSFNLGDIFKRIELWKYAEQQLSLVSDPLALYIHQRIMDGSIFKLSVKGATIRIHVNPVRMEDMKTEVMNLFPTMVLPRNIHDHIIHLWGHSTNNKFKLIISMMHMYSMVTDRMDPDLHGVNRYKAYKYNIPLCNARTSTTSVLPRIYDKYGVAL